EATCTTSGIKTLKAYACGDSVTEVIPATGQHNFGEWIVVKEPTVTEEGRKERTCSSGGEVESQVIPKLSTTDNTSNDSTKDNDAKTVNETIRVTVEESSTTADVIITKDSTGKIIEAYAVLHVEDAQVKNSKAEITVDKDLIEAILKKSPNLDRIEIVIEKAIVDLAGKESNANRGINIKVSISNDIELKAKQIILSGEALNAAKKAGTKLAVEVTDGDKPAYVVTVPQAVLEARSAKFADVDITLDASKKSSSTANVSIGEEGSFPMAVNISILLNNLLSTKTNGMVYIYKVNDKTGQLEEVPNNEKAVSKTGYVSMSTLSGGEYVFTTIKRASVTRLVDKVTVSAANSSVSKGGKISLRAVLPTELALVSQFTSSDPYGKEETKVTYSVSDHSIATISSSGKLVAKKAGKVKVMITILLENKESRVIEKTITVK
ncbi:MAG TPA: hypothetical protein VHQ24_06305, partial [Lachnospiraceae bacterium]|nr:hypothetical protein [Lachnospiraceae bacterium]